MKTRDKRIHTYKPVTHMIKPPPTDEKHIDIEKDLEKYAEQLSGTTDEEIKTVKQQILKNISFKREKEQEKGAQSIMHQLIPFISDGKTDNLSQIDDKTPVAPVLEDFEDYAPVDTPVTTNSKQPSPTDKGYIHVKQDLSVPKALNELETTYQSKFSSEYRVPWSGKKGKDELSNFFDTYNFDAKFDQIQKHRVACPTEWNNKGTPSW